LNSQRQLRWIPAFAGMTATAVDFGLRRNDGDGNFAGITATATANA
jgi:hypothetical protein